MSAVTNFSWLLLLSCCAYYYKLPSTFTKCNRKQSNFSECLTTAVEGAIRQLNKPVEGLGLCLDPLDIPFISAPRSASIDFQQNYVPYRVLGLSNATCSKVDMNFETKNLTIDCSFPQVTMLFNYHFDGKLMDMPIFGAGPGTFALETLGIHLVFSLTEYEKHGHKFYTVTAHELEMKPGKLINVNLENLFNGDVIQGYKINKILNERGTEFFEEIKSGYEDAFGSVFSAIFNTLLENVPISEIFDDK